jgi:large subunit ribosomal protein L10
MALIWGGEDIISLAKEVVKIAEDKNFEPFSAKGGVMDGQRLAADQVKQVSKWPSRLEQLSILSGQILGVGSKLSGQLIGVGSKLASQIKKKSEEEGEQITA